MPQVGCRFHKACIWHCNPISTGSYASCLYLLLSRIGAHLAWKSKYTRNSAIWFIDSIRARDIPKPGTWLGRKGTSITLTWLKGTELLIWQKKGQGKRELLSVHQSPLTWVPFLPHQCHHTAGRSGLACTGQPQRPGGQNARTKACWCFLSMLAGPAGLTTNSCMKWRMRRARVSVHAAGLKSRDGFAQEPTCWAGARGPAAVLLLLPPDFFPALVMTACRDWPGLTTWYWALGAYYSTLPNPKY